MYELKKLQLQVYSGETFCIDGSYRGINQQEEL